MRVLRLIGSLDPAHGGPPVSTLNSCIAVQRTGVETTFAFPLNTSNNEPLAPALAQLRAEGIETMNFPFTRRLGRRGESWGVSLGLGRWIKQHRKDFHIVHCHGAWQYLTLMTAMGNRQRRPSVLTPNESLTKFDLTEAGSPLTRAAKRRLHPYYLKKFDRIVVASQLEARDTVPAEMRAEIACEVILHPVFDERGAPPPAHTRPPARDGLRLGYLGRLDVKKNLDVLIRALSRLPQGITLSIGGEGPQGDGLRSLAREIGVGGRVAWLGFVHAEAKGAFFGDIDVLVMPSQYECFGLVAAEAMVAGVPVIVTPETGMGEIVERHGAGAIVRPAPEPLGDCIAFLAQNPRMLDEYGRNALKAAEADLSFSAHGAALRRCYDRLLAE